MAASAQVRAPADVRTPGTRPGAHPAIWGTSSPPGCDPPESARPPDGVHPGLRLHLSLAETRRIAPVPRSLAPCDLENHSNCRKNEIEPRLVLESCHGDKVPAWLQKCSTRVRFAGRGAQSKANQTPREGKVRDMAILTLKNLLGRERSKDQTVRLDCRKVVSIEEYRGVVLLPPSAAVHPVLARTEWTGPVPAT